MKSMKLKTFVLATATLFGTGAANASVYYGLGFTENLESTYHDNRLKDIHEDSTNVAKLHGVFTDSSIKIDNGSGVTGLIGVPVNKYLAIEGRYTYFKDMVQSMIRLDTLDVYQDANGDYKESVGVENFDFNTDAHKFGLHAVYRHNLSSLLYLKGSLGVTHTYADRKGTFSFTSAESSTSESLNIKGLEKEKTELEGGLGIGLRLSACCNLELEYNESKYQKTATAKTVFRF